MKKKTKLWNISFRIRDTYIKDVPFLTKKEIKNMVARGLNNLVAGVSVAKIAAKRVKNDK